MNPRTFLFILSLFVALLSPSFVQTQARETSILLAVDATDAPRKLLHVYESLTVQPGALTLLYPQWIPGEHGPTGPVVDVAGLKITAGDNVLSWRRDLVNMYAIQCDVPSGVETLNVSFDFILPPNAEGFSSGASSSAKLLVLSWNQVVLYPSTPKPDDITVTASLTVPAGWNFASSLVTTEHKGNTIRFGPVSLTMLVDSPVLTGVHSRRIDLTPASGAPNFLNIFSDDEASLEMSQKQISAYRHLVVEANALFGAHHYHHYDFLYTLSDQVAHFGLEHHQSSDDRLAERTLLDDALRTSSASLLPHEFVHSWNGKHRRPAGLATEDFSTPMKDDLLWVYEGLTQYLGLILTARSGLWTPEEYREDLAYHAAFLDNRPGREWRPLQDANDEAQLLYDARDDWDSWRREVDFYDEGNLIWLEADVMIRQLTKGKKSLDDFCRKFHGGENSGPSMKPYTFEDVVATLSEVVPYDWRSFFNTRLQSLNAHAPMGGIEKSGWKLVYTDTSTGMQKSIERERKYIDFRFSLGIVLKEDATVRDVVPGSAAAKAGIGPGMKLIAVNGRQYSKEGLRTALRNGKTSSSPMELLVANGEFYATYPVDYHGGERYPHLERDPSNPDLLSVVISPIVVKGKSGK